MATGFGGSSKKQEVKLKPKAQWDRFADLKGVPKVKVAVKQASSADWLEVGSVRAQAGVSAQLAVAKQRKIIAEVSLMLLHMRCVY
jgi:hypothetical protein